MSKLQPTNGRTLMLSNHEYQWKVWTHSTPRRRIHQTSWRSRHDHDDGGTSEWCHQKGIALSNAMYDRLHAHETDATDIMNTESQYRDSIAVENSILIRLDRKVQYNTISYSTSQYSTLHYTTAYRCTSKEQHTCLPGRRSRSCLT